MEAIVDEKQFLFKKKMYHPESMSNEDWASLIIEFFEFCKPALLSYKGLWQDMEQPLSYERYDGFRYVDYEKWAQGTLGHLLCKTAAAYADKQSPKMANDVVLDFSEGVKLDLGGRKIYWGDIEKLSDMKLPIALKHTRELQRKRCLIVIEGALPLLCEVIFHDIIEPWNIGWVVVYAKSAPVTSEELSVLFEKKLFEPQEILRAIFEFSKEVIYAEQMRTMQEKTEMFTKMFSDSIIQNYL